MHPAEGYPFTDDIQAIDTETNLPDNTSDKILMLWTYQYLKSLLDLVIDIRENPKDDGLFLRSASARSLREKHGWNVAPIEKKISDIIDSGFDLIRIN